MKKKAVYMMPGMAANPSIFEYIKLPDCYDVYWMHWIIPEKDESLSHYVSRLISEQINHSNPILLGVSFGGIVVQEMAKQITVEKLILISTVKHHDEFPKFLKTSLKYKLYKLFPTKFRIFRKLSLLEKIPSKSFKKKMKFYKRYLDVNDPRYLSWAIITLLKWKQTTALPNYVHIHGSKDQIFGIKNIKKPVIIVEGGRHDMIIRNARWFNRNIKKLIQND